MKHFTISLLALTALLFSCKSSEQTIKSQASMVTEQWIIANLKAPCDDTRANYCYRVKRNGASEYKLMDVEIENFNYEENHKYQIEVNIVRSKKGETSYIFKKEIFKVQHY